MSKVEQQGGYEQLTIFQFMELVNDKNQELSSADLSRMIDKLQAAKKKQEQIEAQRRQQEEQERKKQEERLRKEKEEAHIQEVTSMDLPLDWENVFLNDASTNEVHADSISDGLILCLSNLGRVDIEYISAITGENYKNVISTLKGSIYQNPDTWNECFYQGWETADEYLSGNMRKKFSAAYKANEKYKGYFEDNVKAIRRVVPPEVATKDIYITLGSPWVPTYVIDDFIEHLFGMPYDWDPSCHAVKHDTITGTWEIPEKNRYHKSIPVTETYGTDRMNALHILERTLNMKSVAITDEVYSPDNNSGKKRVVNQAETTLVIEKQKTLIKAFQEWVWASPRRREHLKDIYERNYGCIRKRNFDGSFLTFPGLNPEISLYPYQKDAVARIIFSQNTLLAHDVGAGKTYVMIAAGMELKRMGLSKKNMYVVPNNIVGQWKSVFLDMYANANLLCVDSRNFKPSKRDETLELMKNNDYDAIIIAYSCFEQIPLSKECYLEELKEQGNAIANAINENKNNITHRLRKRQNEVKEAIYELMTSLEECSDGVCFDELGINYLFVDEAHNFKNVPIKTQNPNIMGINATGSKKCQDMMDKVWAVQRKNFGKGVVFATGTPITNSVTDAYVMQRYLQSGELALLELGNFDSWVGMFAERNTDFEIDVDTSNYRMATRLSKFHNLPELTTILASIADFHQVDENDGIPGTDGYLDIQIPRTDELSNYLEDISERAENVRKRRVKKNQDNMLLITTDGRKAALDIRLVKPGSGYNPISKVTNCAKNIRDIYFETNASKLTQLVFCDTSTPKQGFNVYDELKQLLVYMGVNESEIAYVHEATTEVKRTALFNDVRKGKIRILIGSTFKVGIGVNIQDRLVALHHLDVPWRPADMVQREGRILRQGNINEKVKIFRYITEGSFDAYSWQLLETKQRFITELLSGSMSQRSENDIDDTVLDYAEVKALAIGNPLLKERVEIANELSRVLTLQQRMREARIKMETELDELPQRISALNDRIEACKKDITDLSLRQDVELPDEKKAEFRNRFYDALLNHQLEPQEKVFGYYRGFDIILPANMTANKMHVYLQGRGRYDVTLALSSIGNMTRINNFINSFEKHLEDLELGLTKLKARKSDIESELSRDENYSEQIESLKSRLSNIDKKLGVEK